MKTLQQIKTETLAELSTIKTVDIPSWLAGKIDLIINEAINSIKPLEIDLSRELTDQEKVDLKAQFNQFDDVNALKERAYGFNEAVRKFNNLETTFKA